MPVDIGEGVLHIRPGMATFKGDLTRGLKSALLSQEGILKSWGGRMMLTGGALTAGLTLPLVKLGKAAIGASIDFEQAFAGIRKTIQATEEEYAALAKQFQDMALVTPLPVEQLLNIGRIAGQLGVVTEQIGEFSDVIAALGVSTDMTTEAGAMQMARLANIMKLPQTEFRNMGDAIVKLGNNMATTESTIMSMTMRIAGSATTLGMSAQETMALASALSSVGVAAELGGTAISQTMIRIAGAVAEGGDKLKKFADVAGMTSQEFSALWKKSAAEGILAFLKGLQRLQAQGSGVFKALEDLGMSGIRIRDVLLRASSGADKYEKALGLVKEATGALQRESDIFYNTAQNKMVMAVNKMRASLTALGDQALPFVTKAIEFFGGLLGVINALPGPLKTVIGLLTLIGAALGPVMLVIGALVTSRTMLAAVRGMTAQVALSNAALAKSYDAVAVAASRAAAAEMAAVANIPGGAGVLAMLRGGTAGAATGAATSTAVATGAAAGTATSAGILRGLRLQAPKMSSIFKGFGIMMAGSFAGALVNMLPTQGGTTGDRIKKTISSTLTWGAVGAGIGQAVIPIPGIGALIGGGLGLLGGGLSGWFGSGGTEAPTAANQPEWMTNWIRTRQRAAYTPLELEELDTEGAGGVYKARWQSERDTGYTAGLEIARGLAEGYEQYADPTIQQFQQDLETAVEDWNNYIKSYNWETPTIFSDPFKDEVGTRGTTFAQMEEYAEHQRQHFTELQGIIDELNSRGLTGLATQISEAGPEALTEARVIYNQLLTDPNSVFNLEATILNLAPGVQEALRQFFNFGPTGLTPEMAALLPPDDVEAATQGWINTIIGGTQDRDDLRQLFATQFAGPLADAMRQSLQDELIAEGFKVDPATIEQGLLNAFSGYDPRELYYNAARQWVASAKGGDLSITREEFNTTFGAMADQLWADMGFEGAQTHAHFFFDENGQLRPAIRNALGFGEVITESQAMAILEQEGMPALSTFMSAMVQKAYADVNSPEFINSLQGLELPEGDILSIIVDRVNADIGAIAPTEMAKLFNFTSIKSALGEGLVNIGEGIPAGVVSGITSGVLAPEGDMSGAITDELEQMIADSEDALEEESPSKVFQRIGEGIVAGLTAGLTTDTLGSTFLTKLGTLKMQASGVGFGAGYNFAVGFNSGLRSYGFNLNLTPVSTGGGFQSGGKDTGTDKGGSTGGGYHKTVVLGEGAVQVSVAYPIDDKARRYITKQIRASLDDLSREEPAWR